MSLRDAIVREYRRIRETIRFYRRESVLPGYVPRGHYSSPLPDVSTAELTTSSTNSFEDNLVAINLNTDSQHETLLRIIELYRDFDWTLEKKLDRRFCLDQGYFKEAASLCL